MKKDGKVANDLVHEALNHLGSIFEAEQHEKVLKKRSISIAVLDVSAATMASDVKKEGAAMHFVRTIKEDCG